MDCRDFHKLARTLSSLDASDGANYRTATSRAYYGAYLYAHQFILNLGLPCHGGGSEHKWTRDLLVNCNVESAQKIGRELSNLQERRKSADYKMENAAMESQENAKYSVQRADRIISDIEKLLTEPAELQKVKAGMLQYRRLTNQ